MQSKHLFGCLVHGIVFVCMVCSEVLHVSRCVRCLALTSLSLCSHLPLAMAYVGCCWPGAGAWVAQVGGPRSAREGPK